MEIGIKAIIWTYRNITEAKKNLVVGEHEVRIRMIQARVPKYIATGFSSSEENWNTTEGYPEKTHPRYRELVVRIDKLIEDIQFEIKVAEKGGRLTTPAEIKATIKNKCKATAGANKPNKILAYIQNNY